MKLLEKWYLWSGKDYIPPLRVKKVICQCHVLIDDSKYLNSPESGQHWFGYKPFIQAYTLGELVESKRAPQ